MKSDQTKQFQSMANEILDKFNCPKYDYQLIVSIVEKPDNQQQLCLFFNNKKRNSGISFNTTEQLECLIVFENVLSKTFSYKLVSQISQNFLYT